MVPNVVAPVDLHLLHINLSFWEVLLEESSDIFVTGSPREVLHIDSIQTREELLLTDSVFYPGYAYLQEDLSVNHDGKYTQVVDVLKSMGNFNFELPYFEVKVLWNELTC